MAAQGKTTAVHFSLIFFVMLSVILGVVAYLFHTDYRELQASAQKSQAEAAAGKSAITRYQQEVEGLKKVIGSQAADVGAITPSDASVIGQATSSIQTFGKSPGSPSLIAALQALRAELDNRVTEIAERQTTISELQRDLQALRGQYETQVSTHAQKRREVERDLQGEQGKFEESLASKDRQIGNLQQQLNGIQTELAQERERLNNRIAELNKQNAEYVAINEKLNHEIEIVKGESFEVPDGRVTKVDQVARTVYISLGSKDGLKKRISFSVYPEHNSGIGRDTTSGGRKEEIKGSIEVTRILDNKLAEARILNDDPARPISPGDLIYTPLWSPGRIEQFAFVGMIDVDGDGGFEGDRERLHELIRSNEAQISSEVDDKGERIGGPIDEQTRFLVIGTLPDPTQVADDARRAELKQMMEHRKAMIDEARRYGVRVVSLRQFLDFIGYVPQRRLFVPGQDAPYGLEAGARSSGRAIDIHSRTSSGNTSGLYNQRGTSNPSSSGNTSQIFGGRGTGTGY